MKSGLQTIYYLADFNVKLSAPLSFKNDFIIDAGESEKQNKLSKLH